MVDVPENQTKFEWNFCMSHSVITLRKGMNSTILPSVLDKIVGSLPLVWQPV